MSGILETLTQMMRDNLWAAPVFSLLAGIITSFTPCSLSSVPMLLTYVGAAGADRKRVLRLSLTMALGMSVTFGIFGSVASAVGHYMHEAGHWWATLMGILMVLMALQVFGIINIIPHIHVKKTGGKGYLGAFLCGALGGLFASHCAIPVMIALLALVAELGSSAWWGIFLMVLYALGHSVLLVAAGMSYGYLEELMSNPGLGSVSKWLRRILGVLIFAVGLILIFGE